MCDACMYVCFTTVHVFKDCTIFDILSVGIMDGLGQLKRGEGGEGRGRGRAEKRLEKFTISK